MNDAIRGLPTVVWHTLAVYVFLIVALRLIGRPIMTQLNLVGTLVVALLGSAVETTLYNGSSSLVAGLGAAATLFLSDRATAFVLARSSRLRALLIGTPLVLVKNGRLIGSQVRRAGLTRSDVLAAIRERGYEDLQDVRWAILEINGLVSVIPRATAGA
jgi:uncharacterized membrane protein YcaP (DUF421 family)